MDNNISKNAQANTVPAKNQLKVNQYVEIVKNNGKMKILFVGNSITRHAPAAHLGWFGDWGMAASKKENDYVHRVVSGLEEKYGSVDYCITQLAEWEISFWNGTKILNEYYQSAKEFNADVIVIRLGENIKRDKLSEIDLKPYFDEMIKFLIGDNTKKVIITDDFWSIPTVDKIIKEIADENNYTFCRIGDLELDKKNMAIGEYENDGVAAHPSDLGMKRIAERILKLI